MKSIFQLLAAALVAPAMAAPDPRNPDPFEAGLRQVMDDYRKGNSEAVLEKLRGLTKMMEEKGAKKVGGLLPENIESWKGTALKQDDLGIIGGGVSTSRVYQSGKKEVTVKGIKDSPFVKQLLWNWRLKPSILQTMATTSIRMPEMTGRIQERTTIRSINMMAKSIKTLSTVLLIMSMMAIPSYANTVAVPEPSKALIQAPYVASGHLVDRKGTVYFIPNKIIKGTKILKDYKIAEIVIGELFPPALLVKAADGKEIIFLGEIDLQNQSLKPTFGMCSVWPYGTQESYLKERTLAGCKALAEKVVSAEPPQADK